MDPLEQRPRRNPRPIRWWPVWVILIGAISALVIIRLWPELSHQERNIATAQALVIPLLLLVCWVGFFSRLPWRAKVAWLSVVIGPVLLVCFSLRIRGVSGDLLPILEWRFHSVTLPQPLPTMPASAPSPAGAVPLPLLASTNDYPQFLGPHRNGTVDGPVLDRDWAGHAPRMLWRKPVGAGWSGFAVAGSLAITLEQHGEQETVVGYDLLSGKVLWTHADGAHYQTTIAGEGPRTTPTVSSNRVYTLGATGLLNCLELATGRLIWSKDVPKDNDGRVGEWGVSCSPLVVGNSVFVTTDAKNGRSMAAYDATTGRDFWRAGDDRASYSSPIAALLAGTGQVLSFNSSKLVAHEATSGRVLWEYRWPTGHPHIVTPLILSDDQVVVSSGYGTGSELVQISRSTDGKWGAQRVWKSNRLKSKFANLIHRRGYLYGLDDGIMVCLNAATGQLQWKDGRYGHGQMILSDDLLLVMAENGDVVLVEPIPERHLELTRFSALRGKTWNPPALAGPYLLVRNDQEAACYQLPIAKKELNPKSEGRNPK